MQYPPPSILEKTEENSGFTLIELSIVLVIVALLIGGVLVGKDLIESAAVRAQISQIEQFNTAVNAFKEKYNCMPGDCRNGAQYGFAARTNATGQGDGNNMIQGAGGTCGISLSAETRLFWRDLSNANLIPYTITGVADTTTIGPISASSMATYFPQGKIKPGSFVGTYCAGWQRATSTLGDGNNYFEVMGIELLIFGNPMSVPVFTAVQAYSLDAKIDDGLPQFGNVVAFDSSDGWASGIVTSFMGGNRMNIPGSYDGDTTGPITTATTNPVALTAGSYTCYDSGAVSVTYPQRYSTSINGGKGLNCVLSIKMQ